MWCELYQSVFGANPLVFLKINVGSNTQKKKKRDFTSFLAHRGASGKRTQKPRAETVATLSIGETDPTGPSSQLLCASAGQSSIQQATTVVVQSKDFHPIRSALGNATGSGRK